MAATVHDRVLNLLPVLPDFNTEKSQDLLRSVQLYAPKASISLAQIRDICS